MEEQVCYELSCALPPAIAEETIENLNTALGEDESILAFSCMRQDNRPDESWVLTWYLDHAPEGEDFRARLLQAAQDLDSGLIADALNGAEIKVAPVADIDWLEHVYQSFPPFDIACFHIFGSHYPDEWPEGQIPLKIDAATAFGSGEHGTTRGCLEAVKTLYDLGFAPARVLDMGTGSGILAIGAARLWPDAAVTAVDNDPRSVSLAGLHADMNRALPAGPMAMTRIFESNGFHNDDIDAHRPYDLILANILAGPLKDMAADLSARLAAGGYAILSGLLVEQADDVLASYQRFNHAVVEMRDHNGWRTITLQKPV